MHFCVTFYQRAEKQVHLQGGDYLITKGNKFLKIGLMSRLEFGSIGYREGLWHLAANIFQEEDVDFAVIVGGLIDEKELKLKIKGQQVGLSRKEQHEVEHKTLREIAYELAQNLPHIGGKKIRILPSPSHNFDGELGLMISEMLVDLRDDIVLWRQGSSREELRKIKNKILGFYTPKETSFRSKYYDTPNIRILVREADRSTRGLGDFNLVGCGASSVINPGESTDVQRPFASLPGLAKIDKNRSGSDNQIGVRILILNPDHSEEVTLKTYNFKDVVAGEWQLVEIPSRCSATGRKIIEIFKSRGPLNIGQLVDFSGLEKDAIEQVLNLLVKIPRSRTWPGLYFDEDSRCYTFVNEWFQKELRYSIDYSQVKQEKFLAFSCLHAGCKHTDMHFFTEEVPQIIDREEVGYLVGLGDFIEGYEHNLLASGEAYGSRNFPPNYDWQESLAAFMLAKVICRVFDLRIKKYKINKRTKRDLVRDMVQSSLITFLYIAGNHCEWTLRKQVSALSVFSRDLQKFVKRHIEDFLIKKGISINGLMRKILDSRIIRVGKDDGEYKLPSGLKLSLMHPEMGRTQTPSIRLQGALKAAPECHLVFEGNFHTAEALEEWHHKLGQRFCGQLGTLKVKSKFETGKLKTVDFGVGIFKIYSTLGSEGTPKILISEASFRGQKRKTSEIQESNQKILEEFEKYILGNEPNSWKI